MFSSVAVLVFLQELSAGLYLTDFGWQQHVAVDKKKREVTSIKCQVKFPKRHKCIMCSVKVILSCS